MCSSMSEATASGRKRPREREMGSRRTARSSDLSSWRNQRAVGRRQPISGRRGAGGGGGGGGGVGGGGAELGLELVAEPAVDGDAEAHLGTVPDGRGEQVGEG